MDCMCTVRFDDRLKNLIESHRNSEAKSILNKELKKVDDCCGTLLHHAVSVGNVTVARFLIEQGMTEVDARDDDDLTPLHVATKFNNLELAKLLVDHGADVNALNARGRQCLVYVARKRNVAMLRFLLEHGAEPNPVGFELHGHPLFEVLVWAKDYGEEVIRECAELLLRHEAFPRKLQLFVVAVLTYYENFENDKKLGTKRLYCVVARDAIMGGSIVNWDIEVYPREFAELKEYYEMCRQVLEVTVLRKLVLRNLLVDDEFKIRTHARHKEFVPYIKKVCDDKRLSELYPYYNDILMERVEKALVSIWLEDTAIPILCKLLDNSGSEFYIAARKVVGYLNERDLQQLCRV